MQFTRIPDSYLPLGGPVVYAFDGARSDYEVRLTDSAQERCYGVKRFAGVTGATFDIAPYLRRACTFRPEAGPTGICSADGRSIAVRVQLTDCTTQQQTAAPVRIFLAAAEAAGNPALLTSMPLNRLIAAGERDELTLLTRAPLELTLRIGYGPHTATETHRLPTGGLHRFRLDTADFPGADRITVEAGACGTVDYAVLPPVPDAVRLAWRSRAGSLEHYTFPVEAAAGIETARQQAYGAEGYVSRTTVAPYRKLRSALERREVLEALAELLVTPEVWIAEGERYTPVEVVSDRAVVHTPGALRWMEITIRPKTKTAQPWNC